MTQEEKNLLLKDLCARLQYGVKVLVSSWDGFRMKYTDKVDTLYSINGDGYIRTLDEDYNFTIEEVKPYLFHLSSMTEEQQEEFDRTYADDIQVVANNLKNRLDGKPCETNLGHYRHTDWLNKNHFDYRGLIEKGLALDATGKNIY